MINNEYKILESFQDFKKAAELLQVPLLYTRSYTIGANPEDEVSFKSKKKLTKKKRKSKKTQ